MTRRPTNPARRKHRMAVYTILPPLLLAALLPMLDFPFLTAQGALATIQKRYALGSREVVAWFGPQQEDMSPLRYYIAHDGDWLVQCSVKRGGLFWRPGALTTAHLDGEAPLTIPVSPALGGRSRELTVVSGGPDAAVVEVDYLPGFDLLLRLETARRGASEDQCFFFILEDPYHGLLLHASPSAYFRIRCYDADGKLLYESPYPARWLEYPILGFHLEVVTP